MIEDRMMKRLFVLMVLLAIPLLAGATGELVDRDIPTGTEAGVVQQLSLAKGQIMISGRQLGLSQDAIESLLGERKIYGTLVGKVVVFEVTKDPKGDFVKDLFVEEKRR